jgi:hypothetical protein
MLISGLGQMSATITDPRYWIERAKETRELAEQINDPLAKRALLAIAQGYLIVARRAEERTRS